MNSKIYAQLRKIKNQIGAAEAMLSYAKTREEIQSAENHLATLKARRSVIDSHFEHAKT